MANSLQSTIQQLSSSFAASVATAIRGASLEDILALAGARVAEATGPAVATRRPVATRRKEVALPAATAAAPPTPAAPRGPARGRLRRRSSEDIASALAQIVSLVKSKKGGLRAEQIRVALKMEAKEMPRILKQGVATKALKTRGQKRATTYMVA